MSGYDGPRQCAKCGVVLLAFEDAETCYVCARLSPWGQGTDSPGNGSGLGKEGQGKGEREGVDRHERLVSVPGICAALQEDGECR